MGSVLYVNIVFQWSMGEMIISSKILTWENSDISNTENLYIILKWIEYAGENVSFLLYIKRIQVYFY